MDKIEYNATSFYIPKTEDARPGDALAQRLLEHQGWGRAGWTLVTSVALDRGDVTILSDTFTRPSD